MLWFLFSIFVCYLAFWGEERNNNNYIISRVLLVVALSYMSGFGSSFAEDHIEYVEKYIETTQWLNSDGISLNNEIGYRLLNVLGHKLCLGIPGFFFLIGLIVNSFFVNLLYRFPLPVVSIFLFIVSPVYLQEANLVRQSLSISIFLYSIIFLQEKKIFSYLVILLLAISFHMSALLLLPFILVAFIDFPKYFRKIKTIMFLLWISSFLVQYGVISIDLIFQKFYGMGFERYEGYLEGKYGIGAEGLVDINYIFLNLFVLLSFFVSSTKHYIYYFIFILSGIFMNITFVNSSLFRVNLYFSSLLPFFITTIYTADYSKSSIYVKKNLLFELYVIFNIAKLFHTYILENGPVLGAELYPLSDFFAF